MATQTQFIPYSVEKTGIANFLIGKTHTTNITVTGNDLGPLNDFQFVDVIPNTRKFVGFTDVSAAGNVNVLYDTPNPGEVTLDFSQVDVPTGGQATLSYETL